MSALHLKILSCLSQTHFGDMGKLKILSKNLICKKECQVWFFMNDSLKSEGLYPHTAHLCIHIYTLQIQM